MSDTEQEPSMEEILASIRRIISDDDKEIEAATQENEEGSEVKDELLEEDLGAMPEPAVEPAVEPAAEPEPAPVAEVIDDDDDDDDILDLTDMEAADPEPLFEEQAYKEAEPEPEPAPIVSPTPPPQPAPSTPAPATLVSPPQAGEARVSFERLTEKLNEDYSELPIGNGAVTLEGLTRELVRPMLKEWLDQHLPMTVERLVREEIERLVMQSQRRDPW